MSCIKSDIFTGKYISNLSDLNLTNTWFYEPNRQQWYLMDKMKLMKSLSTIIPNSEALSEWQVFSDYPKSTAFDALSKQLRKEITKTLF